MCNHHQTEQLLIPGNNKWDPDTLTTCGSNSSFKEQVLHSFLCLPSLQPVALHTYAYCSTVHVCSLHLLSRCKLKGRLHTCPDRYMSLPLSPHDFQSAPSIAVTQALSTQIDTLTKFLGIQFKQE